MQLEDIEQRCLKYLKEAENPLVPIDRLMRHLEETGGVAGMTQKDLVDFLEAHELFRVMEPPGVSEQPGLRDMLAEAGLNTRPCAILDTRVPTQAHLVAGIDEQLLQMGDALTTARAEAAAQNDEVRAKRIEKYLERVAALRKQLRTLV